MFYAQIALLAGFVACVGAAEPDLLLTVDARTLPSTGVLHAHLTIPVSGPSLTLCYPQWIPGTHAPSGPIQNLAGLVCHDEHGTAATWNRDAHDAYRFIIDIPTGATRLVIDLDYLANQPSTNSVGVDVITTPDYSLISWNCCLLVPESAAISHLTCAARIELPTEWTFATSLVPIAGPVVGDRAPANSGEGHDFSLTTVEHLIDAPVLIGKQLDRKRLHAADTRGPEVMLHIAAPDGAEALRDEAWLTCLRRLPLETNLLFGGAWYPRYDFLLILGDGELGLEHSDCSLCGMSTESSTLSQADLYDKEILPHEFVHSWVGKFRRPAGMLIDNYQAPPAHDSLWIYEGLTEYLGRLLATRTGLLAAEEWRDSLAANFREYATKPGRHWRSIRDTCRSTHMLRDPSPHHADLRRDQDFYEEGALFWLAADIHIRTTTHGAKCLDDLCATFFGPHNKLPQGYSEAELIEALTSVCQRDWAATIHHWIDETHDLDPSLFNGSGWRLEEGPAKPGEIDFTSIRPSSVFDAIGILVIEGWITELKADSPAAEAGLAVGDFIYSANGSDLKKNKYALQRAVLNSPTIKKITVKACRNRTTWTDRVITYADGIIGVRLTRHAEEPDLLSEIASPRSAAVSAVLDH